ncbi:MAG: hypothetical protein Aurels2KO_23280 [Aureliella sp.]
MKRLLRLFAVGIALTGTSAATADDFTSRQNGDWTTSGTWTNETAGNITSVPSASTDNVTIVGSNLITLNSAESVNNFSATGGVLLGNGDLTIGGTASIASGVDFRFAHSGSVNLNSGSTFNWDSNRESTGGSGVLTAEFNFDGTTNFNVDTVGVAGTNRLRTTANWNNTGTFTRTAGGTLTVDFESGASFTNSGTFSKSDASNLTFGGPFLNSGDINLSGGGTLTIGNFQHTGGTITVGDTATFEANIGVQEGELFGTGTVDGNVTLGGIGATELSAGSLSTVGELEIDGNLTLANDTKLTLNLGDGVSFDQILVDGDVNVNGAALEIVLDNSATYTVGQEFTFLTGTGGDTTNQFGSVTFVNNHPDFDGTLTVTGNDYSFTITAVPEPSSLAVLGLVSVGAIARRRRRA